jgi:hypothetical protein
VKGKVDETVIEEAARRAFVGDKTGMIEVIGLDRRAVAGSLPSEPNVHTSTVDPRRVCVVATRATSLTSLRHPAAVARDAPSVVVQEAVARVDKRTRRQLSGVSTSRPQENGVAESLIRPDRGRRECTAGRRGGLPPGHNDLDVAPCEK